MDFDIDSVSSIRSQFTDLSQTLVTLDNAGGTCMCTPARQGIIRHLTEPATGLQAIRGPARSDVIDQNRSAIADLLNASDSREIIFGQNMTSLTFHFSRSIGQWLKLGDRILLTRLDHDANISPWLLLAQERGCSVEWVEIDPQDGSLDLRSFLNGLEKKPALVAMTCASNVTGAVLPIQQLTELSHAAGALVFLDAVQYVPHFPIDVQELGCDFLIFSAHKLFGPHMGVLYGRAETLEALPAYQVQSGLKQFPEKFETGNQKGEGIYGLSGAIDYLEELGETAGDAYAPLPEGRYSGRRLSLKQALGWIAAYEQSLSQVLQQTLLGIPGVHPIASTIEPAQRIPVFAFSVNGLRPQEVEQVMLQKGIKIWSGHFHASEVTRALGCEDGLVRVSAAHYNTADEINRFAEALAGIAQVR